MKRSKRRKRKILRINSIPNVSEIRALPEVMVMVCYSKLFEYILHELFSLEKEIDFLNSIELSISSEKKLYKKKKRKLVLKYIIIEEVLKYSVNPEKWISQITSSLSNKSIQVDTCLLLNPDTLDANSEEVAIEILPQVMRI